MERYAYDRSFIGLPDSRIAVLVEEAALSASSPGLVRGIRWKPYAAYWASRAESALQSEPEGYQWTDGGGVSNSAFRASKSSLLGTAWFTDWDGLLHIRIVSGRECAVRSPKGDASFLPFRLEEGDLYLCPFPMLVYPALYRSARIGLPGTVEHVLHNAIRNNPLDLEAWSLLGDWYEDLGEQISAERCREALATIERLRPR